MGRLLLLIATAAAGPAAGIEIALLCKPLGGATGMPGAVVGYIGLAALVLGCAAILPAHRWRLLCSVRRGGIAALVAGTGLMAAGLISTMWGLTAGVLVAGSAAGPLLVVALAEASVRGFHAAMSAGALAGAVGATALFERPGLALAIAGGIAAMAGSAAAVANPVSGAGFDGGLRAGARRLCRSLIHYGAIGFVAGAMVLAELRETRRADRR
ncbi:hypothetical protein [Nocardia sp. NPDC004722]